MNKQIKSIVLVSTVLLLTGCQAEEVQSLKKISFNEVSVHDPSIIKDKNDYYVIGSHMMFAKSSDLMDWTQLQSSVAEDQLFEDIQKELEADFNYAKTNTLWAGDIIQLKDGRYYMYYCMCQGTSPLSVLGVAVSSQIDGPYKKVESILYSGTSPQFGESYNATINPNVIDPHVFFDESERLWMVYGSYSGGVYIMELDENSGLPKDRNSYGKRLIGGNHSRIEAPYVQYNKDTGFYYLFVSFGGLDSFGGYNMRAMRSRNPDGPYEDSQGNQMEKVMGRQNTIFDDSSIEPYGVKLMGNFTYVKNDSTTNEGYVSPGHNSVYYDEKSNKYYLIFHSRFPNLEEQHLLRVHQMWFTEEGWPIVSPLRFSGESITSYQEKQLIGNYDLIQFDKAISDQVSDPDEIKLEKAGKLTGTVSGSWRLSKDNVQQDSQIEISNKIYKGRFISAWDTRQGKQVLSFTGTSSDGVPVFLIERK